MTPTATTPIVPAPSPTEPGPPARSLAHLPVTLFASVMGLGGLSLAWRRAANVWDLPQWPALTCAGPGDAGVRDRRRCCTGSSGRGTPPLPGRSFVIPCG